MIFFLLFFFALYGGMHTYVFFRTRSALGLNSAASMVLALWMIVMIGAPVFIRMLERAGYELPARIGSYVGYLWMGALFLFVSSALVLDLLNLAGRTAGWILRRDFSMVLVPQRIAFSVSLGLALAVSAYGYFEALNIRTERLTIETGKLPPGRDQLTIAQISDVHIGLIVRATRVEKILRIVKRENPDILVSTGDLVDAQIDHLEDISGLLREIHAPHGKFAITGNHEYYAGLKTSLAFTEKSGFTILAGSGQSGIINIAGVNDPAERQAGMEKPVSETALLSGLPKNKFTLFLKHRPQVERDSLGLFDLQLSGHTHKGQIFPFTLMTKIAYPLNSGKFDLGQGSILYASRGSGTWGPPIRFLSKPEVTIIKIIRKK